MGRGLTVVAREEEDDAHHEVLVRDLVFSLGVQEGVDVFCCGGWVGDWVVE